MSDWYGDEDESRRIAELERELAKARDLLHETNQKLARDHRLVEAFQLDAAELRVLLRKALGVVALDAAREGEK